MNTRSPRLTRGAPGGTAHVSTLIGEARLPAETSLSLVVDEQSGLTVEEHNRRFAEELERGPGAFDDQIDKEVINEILKRNIQISFS